MGNREFVVQLELTEDGTKAFADATSENVGNVIQIVYDDNVISAPRVQRGNHRWYRDYFRYGKRRGGTEPCFLDPYRFPFSGTDGDPFQCSRSTAWCRMRSGRA